MSRDNETREDFLKSQVLELYKSLSWEERCMMFDVIKTAIKMDTDAVLSHHAKGKKGNPAFAMGNAIGVAQR